MILFLMFYVIYMIYRSMEAMHMFQQNLYNENNRYLKWIRRNFKRVFSIFDFIPIIFYVFIIVLDDRSITDFVLIASMFIYMYCIYIEYRKNKDNQNKLPLKITSRIKRLFVTLLLLYGILIFFTVTREDNFSLAIMLISLTMAIGLIYFMTYFASILDTPLNKIEYYLFLHCAKKKLREYSNLQVVGITGSYGKTTSKNIVTEILSSKYITRATPKNYNTPYGLMMTINDYLDKFDEVLVAEMGAYTKGRIKNLCDIVHPKYGILTIIGDAHLETFGSKENICQTKFELIESLPKDGVAILNRDDPYQVKYELENDVKIIWVGIDNRDADIYATNIECGRNGMRFDCHYHDEMFTLKTRLLGSHNVYNILAGVALGLYMGIDIENIKASVLSLRATEHRLELKKVGNMYMLDDAYNSNPVGASGALDVLNLMNGTKVVVTPGMVELGKIEKEKNYEFGQKISKVADYVILIGEKKTQDIRKALIDSNYNEDNIFVLNRVIDAYNVINALKEDGKDIYALFENDLPDIYKE